MSNTRKPTKRSGRRARVPSSGTERQHRETRATERSYGRVSERYDGSRSPSSVARGSRNTTYDDAYGSRHQTSSRSGRSSSRRSLGSSMGGAQHSVQAPNPRYDSRPAATRRVSARPNERGTHRDDRYVSSSREREVRGTRNDRAYGWDAYDRDATFGREYGRDYDRDRTRQRTRSYGSRRDAERMPDIRREEYGQSSRTPLGTRGEAARRKRNRRSRTRDPRRIPGGRLSSAAARFPFGPTILLVAVLLVAAIGAFALTNVIAGLHDDEQATQKVTDTKVDASNERSTKINDSSNVFTTTYDWDNLEGSGTSLAYALNGEVVSRVGIDVSEHNGTIDWDKVAADGIDFAYIRIGYRGTDAGNVTNDEMYEENLSGARDAGLDIGVYFFSQATTEDEAREEADYVIEQLDGYVPDYPIAFDLEASASDGTRIEGLTNDELTAIAEAFCDEIEGAGYHATVYGSRADLAYFDLSTLSDYGFWYAEYSDQPSMALRCGIWQYTDSGSVDGIDGDVDLDLDLTSALEQIQAEEDSGSSDSSGSGA